MAKAQSAVQPLTQKINHLFWKESLDDFEFRRLEREITALRNVDERDYFMLMGMLYSVIHDYERSKKAHETALLLRSTPVGVGNFSLSMMRVNHLSEAVEVALQGLRRHQGSEFLIKETLDACCFAGDFAAADEALELVKSSGSTFDLSSIESLQLIGRIRQKLRELDIPESEFACAMEIAAEVCRASRRCFVDVSYEFDHYDGRPGIYVQLEFPVIEPQELVALDDAITEAMVTSDLVHWSDIVIAATRIDFNAEMDAA